MWNCEFELSLMQYISFGIALNFFFCILANQDVEIDNFFEKMDLVLRFKFGLAFRQAFRPTITPSIHTYIWNYY